jgi:4-carboxymuconolactone decarboxylase
VNLEGFAKLEERFQLANNMRIGNDKQFLIKIISQCLPYIGYSKSLNALRCVNEAAARMEENK